MISEIPAFGAGIYPGIQGFPSTTMARQVARESEGSFRWGIELREQQYRPGHIEVQLGRTREVAPEPHALTITATYVHLGVWRHATTVTCAW